MMPKFIVYNYQIDIKIRTFDLMKKSIIYDFFHRKNTERKQKAYFRKCFLFLRNKFD